MPAEKSTAGETRQWNLNHHSEGLNKVKRTFQRIVLPYVKNRIKSDAKEDL
jgi:hypothetical protein